MKRDYYTAGETAKMFGVMRYVIYGWIKDGILPATKSPGKGPGGGWRITDADIDIAIKNLQKHGIYYAKQPLE